MSDILRQVDEDLRKEKLSNLFKKYGLYVILILVIIIGSIIGYQLIVSIDKFIVSVFCRYSRVFSASHT